MKMPPARFFSREKAQKTQKHVGVDTKGRMLVGGKEFGPRFRTPDCFFLRFLRFFAANPAITVRS